MLETSLVPTKNSGEDLRGPTTELQTLNMLDKVSALIAIGQKRSCKERFSFLAGLQHKTRAPAPFTRVV